MARGRMVNQTIAEDGEFNALSIEAQLIYLRTIPHLDRDGLIIGHPSALWGKVAPLMPDLLPSMPKIIEEIVQAGLVIKYAASKTQILFFKGFTKNQIGMRYEREPASTHPVPPGYKRTSEGLVQIDDDKNSTPPQTPPPPTNGTIPHEEREQFAQSPQTSGNMPEEYRQTSGNTPEDVRTIEEKRIEMNRREEKGNAREAETPETSKVSPPSFSGNPSEYLPGLPDPRKNNYRQAHIAELVAEARKLGIPPEQFTKNTDTLLDGFGKKALANVNNANGEKVLRLAKELVLTLAQMDERFRTEEGINSIFGSWKANDYRGDSVPSSDQLMEHASLMISGKVVCNRKKTEAPTVQEKPLPQMLTWKQWCKEKYHADNIIAIGLPESVVKGAYEQYKQQFQQAH